MKTILVSIVCLLASAVQAQTAIIAHKSHSGSAADFFMDPNTNFGEPGPQLIQVVRINDSTYVNVFSEFSGFIYHDTVRGRINSNLDIDSIKRSRYDHIEYINFKGSPDSLRPKTPGLQLQEIETIKPIESETPVNQNPPGKKKKSYLLFLFGITGGGMLLMRLFSRILRPQVTT
ncbi:MAG: hypothetical protein K0S23_205 [Fluviicola sp.]|jgi:hypothetical protein|uniref:hypothetical protein n=1 Tax=Fluviicola sp. TaxID=1917219 RepID=UPI00260C2A89|nr:hypothetical protein [Fluviicola sp.]MDF3025898.1 hypothetical protein [Fluviicola sp.]